MTTSTADTAGIWSLFSGSGFNFDAGDLQDILNSDLVQGIIEAVSPLLEYFGINTDSLINSFTEAVSGADVNAAAASSDAQTSYRENVERIEATGSDPVATDPNFTNISAAKLYELTAEADINNGTANLSAGMDITLENGQSYTLVSQLDDPSGIRAYTLQDTDGNLFTTVPGVDLPENYESLSSQLDQGGDLTSLFMQGTGDEFLNDRDDMLAERGGLMTPGEGGISEQRVALADYIAEIETANPDGSHTMIGHSFGASIIASIPGTSGYLFAPAGVNNRTSQGLDDINNRFDVTSGAADPIRDILGQEIQVDTAIDTSTLGAEDHIAGHIRPGAALGLGS